MKATSDATSKRSFKILTQKSLDIENVHVKLCKFLLGVNKRAVNLAVKWELGRFPIGILCMLQAFKYWYMYHM